MTILRAATQIIAVVASMLVLGCSDSSPTGNDNDPGQTLDLALCSPTGGSFSVNSTNPFWPMQVGNRWTLEGEEDGALLRVVITVLDQTEVVAGVTTRVIEEHESEDGEVVEISRNFFAQASNGTICYFGEDVDDFENGQVVSHGGSWRADQPGNHPGIIMPADPQPGVKFQMESAPGVAEDEGEILAGQPVQVPAGTFTETIRVRETNPLDGSQGIKVYARGTGLVIDEAVELLEFKP